MSAELLSKRGGYTGGNGLLARRGSFEQRTPGQHDFYHRRAALSSFLTLKGGEELRKRASRPVAFAQNPFRAVLSNRANTPATS